MKLTKGRALAVSVMMTAVALAAMGTVQTIDDDNVRDPADLAPATVYVTPWVFCENATQINWRVQSVGSAMCSLFTAEVSDTNSAGAHFISAATAPTLAQQNIVLNGTVAGVRLNLSPIMAVMAPDPTKYRYIPYRYARLRVTSKSSPDSTITGLRIQSNTIRDNNIDAESNDLFN